MEVCKICGEPVDILTCVHCEKHGLTKEEYRLKYGYNDDYGFKLSRRETYTKRKQKQQQSLQQK